MNVVPSNITFHWVLFSIFNKIQNEKEKEKVVAEVWKVD